MKVIITGTNGTLAPYIVSELEGQGHEVITWNREIVPINDQEAVQQFIKENRPDAFFHIATGPVEWLEEIIKAIRPYNIPLLFTSTESVYDDTQEGPFSEEDIPKSTSDYGKYKIECESIIKEMYNEYSYIVRIGWQIALEPKKNNMLTYLVENTPIKASSNWILSTSFMPDTAKALLEILQNNTPGLYHLDGNTENWSFYRLANELKTAFKLDIEIIEDNSFVRNNRLLSNKTTLNYSIKEFIKQLNNK